MGMFSVSPEEAEKWRGKYREAAEPHLNGEEALAVGPFQSTGQYFLTIPLVGQLMGLILYLVYRGAHKRRSGSLPSNYLLVVTPTTVRALAYKPRGFNIRVKGEAASWERSNLRVVEQHDGGMATVLTLEAIENGESKRFKANTPKLSSNPFSAEVVQLLSGRS